tara:strand:- start:163 stop:660 length:498 start_codon:yes stop_codon:yes gene_type:complete
MSEVNQLSYLIDFKEQMVKFLDELIIQLPQEPAFYFIRIFVKDKIPVQDVLGRFMRDCLPYKKFIQEKNDLFFLNSDIIYNTYASEVGKEEMNKFKEIWTSGTLDDEDKECIWAWMILFFKLSMSYYNRFGCVEGWEFDLEEEVRKTNELFEYELKNTTNKISKN